MIISSSIGNYKLTPTTIGKEVARRWGLRTHTISKDGSNNLKREPAIMARLSQPIIVSVGDCYYLVLDFYPWRYLPTSVGMMTMMMPTLMLTMKLIAILMSTNKNGGNDGWGRQRVFVLCLLFQIIILPRYKIEVMFAPNHCDDHNSIFLSFQTRSSSWVDIVYLWLASLTGQVVVQLM